MHSLTLEHWGLLKRVFRYVKGILDFGLHLGVYESNDIHAFSDSDSAGCPIDRKSTSGFVVFLRFLTSSERWLNLLLRLNTRVLLMFPLSLPELCLCCVKLVFILTILLIFGVTI